MEKILHATLVRVSRDVHRCYLDWFPLTLFAPDYSFRRVLAALCEVWWHEKKGLVCRVLLYATSRGFKKEQQEERIDAGPAAAE